MLNSTYINSQFYVKKKTLIGYDCGVIKKTKYYLKTHRRRMSLDRTIIVLSLFNRFIIIKK